MKCSLDTDALDRYLARQLSNVFPDEEVTTQELAPLRHLALQRLEFLLFSNPTKVLLREFQTLNLITQTLTSTPHTSISYQIRYNVLSSDQRLETSFTL